MSGRHAAPPQPRDSWLDGLFAERQVYVRGRGQPHFVTITPRARALRAAGLALLVLAVAGFGSALALGYRDYEAARRELASLRAGGGAAAAATPAGDEVARPTRALASERAGRAGLEAEAGHERAAREVAARPRDAELEAARARAALLGGQLAAAEQARDRAVAELKAARGQPALAAAIRPEPVAAARHPEAAERERDAAWAELAAARQELDALRRRSVAAEAERDRLRADLERAGKAAGVTTVGLRSAALAEAAIVGAKAVGRDPRAELDAALARAKELDVALAEARRRNADLEAYLGRRAPAPPGSAPRR